MRVVQCSMLIPNVRVCTLNTHNFTRQSISRTHLLTLCIFLTILNATRFYLEPFSCVFSKWRISITLTYISRRMEKRRKKNWKESDVSQMTWNTIWNSEWKERKKKLIGRSAQQNALQVYRINQILWAIT